MASAVHTVLRRGTLCSSLLPSQVPTLKAGGIFGSPLGFSREAVARLMTSPMQESVLFSSLPKWKAPWSEFVLSYGVQAIIVGILVWIPVLHPEILEPPKKDYHAMELVPTPVPVNHEPQRQLPSPVLAAKIDPPPPALHLPTP